MTHAHVIWDLEDDADGNAQHILEHGVTMQEVEEILLDPLSVTTISQSSGRLATFGYSVEGRYLAVVWEHIQDDPLTMRPVTAYETPESRPEKAPKKVKSMSKKRIHRPSGRSAAAIAEEKSVRRQFQEERPPLEALLASGDYVVPLTQGEYWDVIRTIQQLREVRREIKLSLSALSAKTGMDRAALSRLENGAYANPTINTLNRYARALGKRIVVQLVDLPAAGGVPKKGRAGRTDSK